MACPRSFRGLSLDVLARWCSTMAMYLLGQPIGGHHVTMPSGNKRGPQIRGFAAGHRRIMPRHMRNYTVRDGELSSSKPTTSTAGKSDTTPYGGREVRIKIGFAAGRWTITTRNGTR